MDRTEQMAADIALAMNGGEWKDGKWYSKGHRDAWVKAVQPYADKIKRLEETIKRIADGDSCVSLLSHPPVCKRAYEAKAALQYEMKVDSK